MFQLRIELPPRYYCPLSRPSLVMSAVWTCLGLIRLSQGVEGGTSVSGTPARRCIREEILLKYIQDSKRAEREANGRGTRLLEQLGN
jgi:hypothetical protein